MMWVYFLEQKLQEFFYFLQFKALTKKQSGNNRKILKTDHGQEFNWEKFDDFCKKYGIKRELTVWWTPQQNSVAERKIEQ